MAQHVRVQPPPPPSPGKGREGAVTPLDVTCVAKPSLGCAGLAGLGSAWLGCVAGLGLASLGCVASLHFNPFHTPQVGRFKVASFQNLFKNRLKIVANLEFENRGAKIK